MFQRGFNGGNRLQGVVMYLQQGRFPRGCVRGLQSESAAGKYAAPARRCAPATVGHRPQTSSLCRSWSRDFGHLSPHPGTSRCTRRFALCHALHLPALHMSARGEQTALFPLQMSWKLGGDVGVMGLRWHIACTLTYPGDAKGKVSETRKARKEANKTQLRATPVRPGPA